MCLLNVVCSAVCAAIASERQDRDVKNTQRATVQITCGHCADHLWPLWRPPVATVDTSPVILDIMHSHCGGRSQPS